MKLLVSVRDAQEARDAIAGGADWVDLKEPLAGALGPVNVNIALEVTDSLGGCCPISAALGELTDWQDRNGLLQVPGIDVVKLGLAGCKSNSDWQSQWTDASEICSQHAKSLAAVIYADWQRAEAPRPDNVLECAYRAGCKYLLIDTFDKQGLSSLAILGQERSMSLMQLARQRGMTIVLAGSLRINDLPVVVQLPIDMVAIRGAACGGSRSSKLDPTQVRMFRDRLEIESRKGQESNSCITMTN